MVKLPHVETFDKNGLRDWDIVSGNAGLYAMDAPDEPMIVSEISETSYEEIVQDLTPHQALSTVGYPSTRNIALWRFEAGTVNRLYKMALLMFGKVSSAGRNAGFVLNYKEDTAITGAYTWYLVQINHDNQTFSIQYFDGISLSSTVASAALTGLQVQVWYYVTVSVVLNSNGSVLITASLSGGSEAATITFTTNNFLPDNGLVGFDAEQSEMLASYLAIEAIP